MGLPRHAWPIAPVSNEIVPSVATEAASRFVRQRRIGPRPQGIGRKSVFTKPMLAASGAASLLLCGLGGPALSQTPAPAANGTTALPNIVVQAPTQVAGKPKERPKPRVVARRAVSPRTPPAASPTPVSPAEQLAAKGRSFDQARSNI